MVDSKPPRNRGFIILLYSQVMLRLLSCLKHCWHRFASHERRCGLAMARTISARLVRLRSLAPATRRLWQVLFSYQQPVDKSVDKPVDNYVICIDKHVKVINRVINRLANNNYWTLYSASDKVINIIHIINKESNIKKYNNNNIYIIIYILGC